MVVFVVLETPQRLIGSCRWGEKSIRMLFEALKVFIVLLEAIPLSPRAWNPQARNLGTSYPRSLETLNPKAPNSKASISQILKP